MRIVITSNYKLGNETGTAHVAEELSKYLSKKNKVTYICLGEKYSISEKSRNLTILEIPSIEINNISIPLITPDVVYKFFVYLHKFKPTTIHSQNSLFISNLAQIWANLNKVPFIVTFHHVPTEAINHLFPKLPRNLITNLVSDLYKDLSLKKFLINTDTVIALNKYVYKSIRTVSKDVPMQMINNGLDLNKLIKIKHKNDLSKKINFVFIGSYNERKNQEFLIKVFTSLPRNYVLNLYGNKKTGFEYVNKLNLIIKKYKLKNVLLNNYTKNIVKIYKKTDFFISASLKEAQSLAVIEALASSVPVIGLANETISELVKRECGLVFPTNTMPKKFASKLKTYINNIDYKKNSMHSRKSVMRFKIENVASKIEDLYYSMRNSDSKNSRRNIGKYYQEIFKGIIIQK